MTHRELQEVLMLLREYVRSNALDPSVERAFAQVEQALHEELTYQKRMKERTND